MIYIKMDNHIEIVFLAGNPSSKFNIRLSIIKYPKNIDVYN